MGDESAGCQEKSNRGENIGTTNIYSYQMGKCGENDWTAAVFILFVTAAFWPDSHRLAPLSPPPAHTQQEHFCNNISWITNVQERIHNKDNNKKLLITLAGIQFSYNSNTFYFFWIILS